MKGGRLSFPQKANPLPQTPTPRGLRPHTAALRLSFTLRAPLRAATPKRKRKVGSAHFSFIDHSLRSWSTALTSCPHHRVRSRYAQELCFEMIRRRPSPA